MDAIFWNELATLFGKAIELIPDERKAFLDEACKDNATLRKELDSLLSYYEEAPEFLQDANALDLNASLVRSLSNTKGNKISRTAGDQFNIIGTRISRFDVNGLIGAGGMGVVYKAEDSELHRPIALKFLPPLLSADETARERFITEARAASALDHTNVCTVYEVGRTEQGMIFIAMAYYEGETLKEKMKSGVRDEDAVDYVAQIARGLAKAHARSIIHRDVKPANIMVTDEGIVKILDFGLAKMADQQLTRQGATMGTASHMSPEQVRGGKVDHRTDIWSLGIILYQLLEGRLPFLGDYEQAIMYAVANETAAPLSDMSTELRTDLSVVIETCLQKDPENRYKSMDALLEALGQPLSSVHPTLSTARTKKNPTLQKPGKHQQNTNRWGDSNRTVRKSSPWFLGLGLLVLVIAALSIWGVQGGMFAQQVERQHIAVLPFQTPALDNPDDLALASGLLFVLTDLLADLTRTEAAMWVVPASEIRRYEVETSRDALDIFGVNTVLSGSMLSMNERVSLTMELIDPQNIELISSETQMAHREEIGDLFDQDFRDILLNGLVNLFDLDSEVEIRRAVAKKMPQNADAYQAYLQGVGYLNRYDDYQNIDRAIKAFEAAIYADSTFGLAYSGLCDAYWEKSGRTSDILLVDQAIGTCEKAQELGASVPQVMISVGKTFFATGRYDAAEERFRAALSVDPELADAYRWLGRVWEQRAVRDSAVANYTRAIELEPDVWIYHEELAYFYLYSGNSEKARTHFDHVRVLTPDNYLGYNGLGVAARNTEQIGEAESWFKQSLEKRPNAVAYRNLGRLYYFSQRYEEAVVQMSRALELEASDRNWITLSYRAHARYWAGDVEGATEDWQSLVDVIEPLLEVNPNDEDAMLLLMDATIFLGWTERGQQYLQRLQTMPITKNYTPFYIGRAYAHLDQPTLASEFLIQALNTGYSRFELENEPWLDVLRDSGEFQIP